MSSRNQPEVVERVVDDSASQAEREAAIEDLEQANDCDELGDLVRRESLDETYRESALRALATPQCSATLDELADEESLGEDLRETATDLSREVDDGDGQPSSSL